MEQILHRWAEEECNGTIQWSDDEQTPWRVIPDQNLFVHPIRNREATTLKRARDLAARFDLLVYHQTDPRGCSLYLYRKEDAEGIDSNYSMVGFACVLP